MLSEFLTLSGLLCSEDRSKCIKTTKDSLEMKMMNFSGAGSCADSGSSAGSLKLADQFVATGHILRFGRGRLFWFSTGLS